jgi:galactokinase
MTETLAKAFADRFGAPPSHLVRAPGRVNLIGEHVDYCGLPVFPMALQKEVRLALRPREDSTVRIENVDAEFEPVEFEIEPAIRDVLAEAHCYKIGRNVAFVRAVAFEDSADNAIAHATSTFMVNATRKFGANLREKKK